MAGANPSISATRSRFRASTSESSSKQTSGNRAAVQLEQPPVVDAPQRDRVLDLQLAGDCERARHPCRVPEHPDELEVRDEPQPPSSVSSVRGSLNPQSGRAACSPRMLACPLHVHRPPFHNGRRSVPGPAAVTQDVLVQPQHARGSRGCRAGCSVFCVLYAPEEQAALLQRADQRAGAAAVHAEHRDRRDGRASAVPGRHWRRCSRASWRRRRPSRSAGRPCAASAPRARSRAAGSGTCPRTAA